MQLLLFIPLLFLPLSASAQDWKLRDSDTRLDSIQLANALVDQKIVFFDNGESKFSPDGVYSYTYDQGGTAFGRYTISDDSTVCIDFDNGFSRCDMYVRSGEKLVLLTEDGLRFPIRP